MQKIIAPVFMLLLAACAEGMQPIEGKEFPFFFSAEPTVENNETLEAAKTAEKQGDFKLALQFYQQMLEKAPADKSLRLGLADSHRRSGELDQAIAAYDAIIAEDANFIAAKEGKGLALIAKGDFDAPIALLEDVMKIDPARWKTLNALGILFATRTMYGEAQQYFQEALKFSTSNPSVTNNLALAQAFERKYTDAISNLTQASGMIAPGSPDRRHVDLNLALVYAVSGRITDARNVAANYYSGAALEDNMRLYSHLAQDEQLAKAYLNMALTENKALHEKTWEDIQAMNKEAAPAASPAAAPFTAEPTPAATETAAPAPEPEAVKKEEAAPAKKPAKKKRKPKPVEPKPEPKPEVKTEAPPAAAPVEQKTEESKPAAPAVAPAPPPPAPKPEDKPAAPSAPEAKKPGDPLADIVGATGD